MTFQDICEHYQFCCFSAVHVVSAHGRRRSLLSLSQAAVVEDQADPREVQDVPEPGQREVRRRWKTFHLF